MSTTSDRPDVLAYPNPATARYLVLVAALLTTGLFVGNWFYTQVHGDEWLRVLLSCARPPATAPTTDQLLADQAATAACQAGVERTRTTYALAGALFAFLAALVVLFASPAVVRRRRALRPLPSALDGAAQRFGDLATDAGVGRRVTPLVGPSTLRDAFSFGAPGRYEVALPPALAVRWRDPALFDPLVRHELAHARHRDISLAWLTRSVWYAVVPLLLAPVLVSVGSGDVSILASYLWRAALLAAVFALLSAALLRAREHAADLRASRWQGDVEAMARVVGAARPVPTTGWRGLVARHPGPDERVDVLRRPAHAARLEVWDGLVGAFLAGLAGPLLVSALSPALASGGRSMQAYLVAALVLGPLLGASVGLAVWRAAFVARVSGSATGVLDVALGAGVGLSLGIGLSLATAGVPGLGGLGDPRGLALPGVACAGATVLSAGLAHLGADLAPRIPGTTWCRVLTLAINAVLFSAVLWGGYVLQALVEAGGWTVGRIALTDMLTTGPMLAVVVVLAVVAGAALAVRPPSATRSWQVEDQDPRTWPEVPRPGLLGTVALGVLGGLGATTVIVVHRLVHGAAGSPAATWDRFEGFQWAIAVAAAVVGAVLVGRDPHRGPGAALLAVPVAALTGVAGYLTLNTALGGGLDPGFVWLVLRPPVVLSFYVLLALAAPAYVVGRGVHLPTRSGRAATVAVTAAAVVLATAGAVAAFAGRAHLVGYNPFATPDPVAVTDPVAAYRSDVMVPLSQAYQALSEHAARLGADPSVDPTTKATRLEAEVVGPVRTLRQQWADPHTDDPALVRAHRAALAALDSAAAKYHAAALGWLATDQASAAAARAEVTRLAASENADWQRWIDEVTRAGGG